MLLDGARQRTDIIVGREDALDVGCEALAC